MQINFHAELRRTTQQQVRTGDAVDAGTCLRLAWSVLAQTVNGNALEQRHQRHSHNPAGAAMGGALVSPLLASTTICPSVCSVYLLACLVFIERELGRGGKGAWT